MGSKAFPVALWRHLLSLLPSAQEMADSSQQLDRVSALVQTGFCDWQESVLANTAQINFRELHSVSVPISPLDLVEESSHEVSTTFLVDT
jgi:hypothetical protein